MDTRRWLTIVFLLAAPLVLVSCGSGHDADERYVLICTNIQIPYWQTAGAGFAQAAQQLKVRSQFVGPDSYDPAAEQQALQQATRAKPAGILISIADAKLMKDDINKAIASGIPVVTLDSDAPESKRLFFIGTNNYQAGLAGGKRLVQELHGKGNVVVFTMPGQVNLQERLRGYRDALENTVVKIARVVDIKGDPLMAFEATTNIIGKQGNKVDGFVALEALAGKEIATVLSNNGIKGKVVMAMDTDPDTLEWVRKGVIAATISQKPYTMAFVGLMMLDRLYHGKISHLDSDWSKDSFAPIPSFVDTGSALIDRNNVDILMKATKSLTTGIK